jgi:hypothetical protein
MLLIQFEIESSFEKREKFLIFYKFIFDSVNFATITFKK